MSCTSALLILALLQGPQPQSPNGSGVRVVVELEGGGQLTGEVLHETDRYVEMKLADTTVVGFERSRIAAIRRAPTEPAAAVVEAALRACDQWYALHDADGRVVGRVHSTVRTDASGQVRLNEEWEFRQRGQATGVTRLEVATADLQPVSCFYHERVQRITDGQVVGERLVRGTVEGEELVVESRTLKNRDRQVYPWRAGLRFPLLALEELRQNPVEGGKARVVELFNPDRAQFERRTFTPARVRRVEWRGKVMDVKELRYESRNRNNTEWIDAASRTVRREVNGPALVAVPTTEALAKRYLNATEPVFKGCLVAEVEARFAFWLPNPTWHAIETEESGVARAKAPLHGATASLVVLDQVDADVMLESAADTVARWMATIRPGFRVGRREPTRVRDRSAILIDGTYAEARPGQWNRFRTRTYVFTVRGQTLALSFEAPAQEFERLLPDFRDIRRSVELHRQGVQANLHGAPLERPGR